MGGDYIMTKILKPLFLTVMLMMTLCSVSFAATPHLIADSHAALGGITAGTDEQTVKSIYGEPGSKDSMFDRGLNATVDVWNYGGSFEIYFANSQAFMIKTVKNNGIATPDGFTVGTSYQTVYNGLGEPMLKQKNSLWYRTVNGLELVFNFDGNNKVKEIRTGVNKM